MIKLGDNGKTRFFFDKYNMTLERAGWANHHIGDALWRTSLACFAANGRKEIVEAVKSCIWKVNGKQRFFRHKTDKRNTCSRDQAIMALVALKQYDYSAYRETIKHLDFRISKKFTWQDGYLWAKEKYILWRILNCYKFLFVRFDKSYSKHLFCWMIWSSKQEMPLLRKLMIKTMPKDNYLCRALLGVKEEIPELNPMNDFRWQRDSPWVQGRELTEEEAEYNTLDLDVLNSIVELNKGKQTMKEELLLAIGKLAIQAGKVGEAIRDVTISLKNFKE